MLDFSAAPYPPFRHQIEDVQTLLDHPYFFVASAMRTGKSKIIVDAAQFLFQLGIINRVLVVAPEPVRSVWAHPERGELRKHLWPSLPALVTEFHATIRQWTSGPAIDPRLKWIVTNYEFIRKTGNDDSHLRILLPYATAKTLLVLDESSAITNHQSEQFKACLKLRNRCGRVVLLNGTPFDTPIHLFAQGNLLHPSILNCKYVTHFKAKYAIQVPIMSARGNAILSPKGRQIMKIENWVNLEDLRQRFAPHTIRRLQQDCLDIPEKLPPTVLNVPLTERTWKIYRSMRDQMIVWIQSGKVSTAQQVITKLIRLSQITAGFLGGIEDAGFDFEHDEAIEESSTTDVQEIGHEKLDTILWLLGNVWEKDPVAKVVLWCRFRAELWRLMQAVMNAFPQAAVAAMVGGQPKAERQASITLVHPDSKMAGPAALCATFGTGSFGQDFSGANISVNCSFDYSLRKFLQAGDRVYGPRQTKPISYYDILATGPKGQKTIDSIIIDARNEKENIATWTVAAWVKALRDE